MRDRVDAAGARRCLAAFEGARRAFEAASQGFATLAADGVRVDAGGVAWLALRIACGPIRIPEVFDSDVAPTADGSPTAVAGRAARFGVRDGALCLLGAPHRAPTEAGDDEAGDDEAAPVVLVRYPDEDAFVRALLARLERALR